MTQKSDGGPAYPQSKREWKADQTGGGFVMTEQNGGMTLRDYFAGQASEPTDEWLDIMQNFDRNRNPYNEGHKPRPRSYFELCADWRYQYADAMIAARNS